MAVALLIHTVVDFSISCWSFSNMRMKATTSVFVGPDPWATNPHMIISLVCLTSLSGLIVLTIQRNKMILAPMQLYSTCSLIFSTSTIFILGYRTWQGLQLKRAFMTTAAVRIQTQLTRILIVQASKAFIWAHKHFILGVSSSYLLLHSCTSASWCDRHFMDIWRNRRSDVVCDNDRAMDTVR